MTFAAIIRTSPSYASANIERFGEGSLVERDAAGSDVKFWVVDSTDPDTAEHDNVYVLKEGVWGPIGGGTVDLTAIQNQLDAQAAVDVAQAAVDAANESVDDAQAAALADKEDAGLAATLDAALQTQITANADLNTAQQTAITANIAAIAALQASIVKPDYEAAEADAAGILNKPDIFDRRYSVIDSDESFDATSFIRGRHELSASLANGSVNVNYAEGMPDGSIIDAGVHLQDNFYQLIMVVGDGSNEKFRNNRGQTSADGAVALGAEGDAVFIKNGFFWDQIRGRCSCMPVPAELGITGSFDESNPLELIINVDTATGGSEEYTSYSVTLDFKDSDQNSRQIIINGDLTDPLTEVGFSGTIESMVIDNSAADIYGEISITISVTDDANTTATATL